MKKLLSLLLCLSLFVLPLFSCGGAVRIEREEWVLVSASLYEEILCVSEEYRASAPNAEVLDATLVASGGTLTLTDKTNGKTYTGTYGDRAEPSPSSADHKATLGAASGRILISEVPLAEGGTVPSLTLTLDDYMLSFIAK